MGILQQEYWSGLPCPPPRESSWPRTTFLYFILSELNNEYLEALFLFCFILFLISTCWIYYPFFCHLRKLSTLFFSFPCSKRGPCVLVTANEAWGKVCWGIWWYSLPHISMAGTVPSLCLLSLNIVLLRSGSKAKSEKVQTWKKSNSLMISVQKDGTIWSLLALRTTALTMDEHLPLDIPLQLTWLLCRPMFTHFSRSVMSDSL